MLHPMVIPPGLSATSWIVLQLPKKFDYDAGQISAVNQKNEIQSFVVPSEAFAEYIDKRWRYKEVREIFQQGRATKGVTPGS